MELLEISRRDRKGAEAAVIFLCSLLENLMELIKKNHAEITEEQRP